MQRIVTVASALVLVAAAFSIGRASAPGPNPPDAPQTATPSADPDAPSVVAAGAALVPFDACEDLASYAADVALEQVGPYGLGRVHVDAVVEEFALDGERLTRSSGDAAEPAPAAQGQPAVSGTNLQVAGVDEPDIAKTDGRLLATVGPDGAIQIVDVSGATPRKVGSYDPGDRTGHAQPELLLSGDRLLALWTTGAHGGPVPLTESPAAAEDDLHPVPQYTPTTQLELIDLTNPQEPAGIARYRIDGAYLSARLIGSDVRVAVTSTPTGLDLRAPIHGGLEGERAAEEHNRDVIRSTDGEDWLPYAVHERLDGGTATTTSEGTAMDCGAVHRPPEPSGLATTSIVTLRLSDDDLAPENVTAVFAPAQTVYSSTERMYVALGGGGPIAMPVDAVGPRPPGFRPPPSGTDVTTTVHAFDVTAPGETRYVASGEVEGSILNQWSLSEHDGYLRLAVTEEDPAAGGSSESAVVVLEERGDLLEEVGRVGGLGKGERIYAVRFEGALGYVVTFRQVDPLYTIDLSDPADPRVRGELKILGYSAYLHPTAPDQLLGVGQDATEEGRTTGTQVSLFDIGDLDAPERVANVTVGGGHSEVEGDHRAFTWWEPERLALVPVVSHGPPEAETARPGGSDVFAGLVAYRVGDARVEEVARVSHGDPGTDMAPIRRSFVVGDRLLTVSHTGVMSTSLDTFETMGFADLG